MKALPHVLPSPEQVWTAYKPGKGRRREKTILEIWDNLTERITCAREASGAMRLWTLAEFRQSKDTVEEIASVFAHAALPCAETLMTLVTSVPPQTTLLIHLLLPELRDRVKALKAAQGLYDFDDMLSVVAESLEGPTGATIVGRCGSGTGTRSSTSSRTPTRSSGTSSGASSSTREARAGSW